MVASVHRRACGQGGLGSPATQLMRAVSWHDNAEVSSPGDGESISRCRADSGRHSAGFVAELGSAKCGWLAESGLARVPTSQSRHRAGVVSEQSRSLSGGAKAELKVAGPHAAQRQVVADARAGGLLDLHAAAVWLALVGGRRAETRRTEPRSRSTRPN